MVRTKISILRRFVVHFFDARQRNEPKKTRTKGALPPCRSPGGCVLHRIRQSRIHKNAIEFFAKRTRLLHSKNFAFAASKRTAKTEGISTERKDELGRGGPWSSRFSDARGLSQVQTLLSPPQKGRRKLQDFLRKEHQTCRDRPPGLSVPMRNKSIR